MHYLRWYRTGDLGPAGKIFAVPKPAPTPRLTTQERFWAKVDKTETCWIWTASLNPGGYGRFYVGRNNYYIAHRWAYEQMVGAIPTGMQLDHLCRVRRCVNPAHLEPVTPRENVRRGLRGVLRESA